MVIVPSLQVFPAHPRTHVHSKFSIRFVHDALFIHGELLQLLASATKTKTISDHIPNVLRLFKH